MCLHDVLLGHKLELSFDLFQIQVSMSCGRVKRNKETQ